ncbi:MAG: DUF99 family protein [Archaeoglobaceae archaeon]
MKLWRFAGFDDSFSGSRACIFGCVTCGSYVEGFMFEEVTIDGLDATEKIVRMIRRSKFREQLKCAFLAGITVAGFNVVDIKEVWEKTGVPVVVVMRRKPRVEEFVTAAAKLKDGEERLRIIERCGEVERLGDLYVQLAGLSLSEAEEMLKRATLRGKIPEPLRIAHLAASAVIHGESRGKV